MKEYDDEFKKKIVETYNTSGKSFQAIANENDLNINTLKYWVQTDKRKNKAINETPNEDRGAWESREQGSRYWTDERIDDEIDFDGMFNPTQSLRAPEPRPGFVQRWVRMTLNNETDNDNMMRRQQQGLWRPRDPQTIKDKHLHANAQIGDMIVMRGMVLMERPQKVQDAALKWKHQRIQDQMTRVETDIRDSQYAAGGMRPYVAPETKTTVERGRPIKVADD